jgi:DNA-binding NarL/FixJ family response regulator
MLVEVAETRFARRADDIFMTASWTAVCVALRLTPREAEIARGLLAGATESMVAASLGLSRHTVHTHVRRLYQKLQAGNRAEFCSAVFSAYVRRILHNRPGAPDAVSPEQASPKQATPK